jgi:hypothetical protein
MKCLLLQRFLGEIVCFSRLCITMQLELCTALSWDTTGQAEG